MNIMNLEMSREKLEKAIESLNSVIIGKSTQIKLILCSLLSDNHVLIEDPPGLGKTSLARSLAGVLSLKFSRIQLTPDVLPLDITGSFVYRMSKEEFEFVPGPIFTNVLLADELNRTTPRTQSALLEAMEERQVTVEGKTFKLPEPFFVIATQNPHEHHGTYPLPESQLDRFGISLSLGYPAGNEEAEIVKASFQGKPYELVQPILDVEDILEIKNQIKKVFVSDEIIEYIVRIVSATRKEDSIVLGASTRASIVATSICKAHAFLEGREFVIPDDVKAVIPFVIRHRLVIRGVPSLLSEKEKFIRFLLEKIEPPVD
ncbi:MAG: MoxR family ATPase [Actinobacteria bacterium]|nr:MoxR family ATPase [Actinomycetota bacterium]